MTRARGFCIGRRAARRNFAKLSSLGSENAYRRVAWAPIRPPRPPVRPSPGLGSEAPNNSPTGHAKVHAKD